MKNLAYVSCVLCKFIRLQRCWKLEIIKWINALLLNQFFNHQSPTVETSRAIVLAASSSDVIKVLVSKCGASVAASVFLAREVSILRSRAPWAVLAVQSQWLSAFTFISHIRLSSTSSVVGSASSGSSSNVLFSSSVFSL